MTLNISPVSFNSKVPSRKVNPAKAVDSAVQLAEDITASKKPVAEQQESLLLKPVVEAKKLMVKIFDRYLTDKSEPRVVDKGYSDLNEC